MRRVREILRLKHACGASDRAIARSLGVARNTVALTLERLAAAGLAWPLPETLSERVLEAMLYAGTSSKQGFRRKADRIGSMSTASCAGPASRSSSSTPLSRRGSCGC